MTCANGCSLLVQDARLPDWGRSDIGGTTRIAPGRRVDVRIIEGVVAEVAERLETGGVEDVLHASGAVMLPGLHDHHLHLRALAAAGRSVAVGPADIGGAETLADALHQAPVDSSGWRRAVGYHESVAGDLDLHVLDSMGLSGPVRVQHQANGVHVDREFFWRRRPGPPRRRHLRRRARRSRATHGQAVPPGRLARRPPRRQRPCYR